MTYATFTKLLKILRNVCDRSGNSKRQVYKVTGFVYDLPVKLKIKLYE